MIFNPNLASPSRRTQHYVMMKAVQEVRGIQELCRECTRRCKVLKPAGELESKFVCHAQKRRKS